MKSYRSISRVIVALFLCTLCHLTLLAETPKARFVNRFPFQLVNGGFIIIEARLSNTSRLLRFMLDTGCSGVSLDSTTAAIMGFAPEITNNTLRSLGEIKAVKFLYGHALELPNLTLSNLNIHINDYRFFYETYGASIDGVIGLPLFKDHIVKVNYTTQEIEMWKPGSISYPLAGFTVYPSVNGMPFVNASITENKTLGANYLFDTGADICLLLNDKYVNDSTIIDDQKKSIDILTAGIGAKQKMKLTTVEQLQVGPYSFKNVPSLIYEDLVNITRYPSSVGIIGIELLRRFNIVFNYPAGEINLTPNNNFKDKFHYGYTGFELYKLNDKVVVDNVMKNSPAEKAGLRTNDIVLGVQSSFTNNLEDYRKRVCNASKKVELHVLRGTQINNIVIEIDSVL